MGKNYILPFLALLLSSGIAYGQNVGINTSGNPADNSSMLDISANDKGVLIPRVALTATNSASPISSPMASLLVYNTATAGDVTPGYYYWTGSAWTRLINQANINGTFINNGTATQTTANFNIQSAAAANVGGVIRGAASQTADLQQWQNSSGTPLARVDASGNVTGVNVSATGNLAVTGTSSHTGAASFSNTVTATGLTTLNGGLTESGTVSITGATNINTSGNNGTAIGTGGTGSVTIGNSTGGITIPDATNFVLNTTTGTKIGTTATQKLGFFNATPVVQQSGNIITGLQNLGLITSGSIASSNLPGSFSGFANPSTTIGLTATNGSATTAMRSDAAPALSVAIVPTWTGLHTFSAGATVSGGQFYNNQTGVSQILLNSSGSNWGNIQNDGANVWSLATGATGTTALKTPVLSWNAAANVGIGTTSPQYKLDVNGKELIRNGGSSLNLTGTQLLFGYGGGDDYMHGIKTRHHSGQATDNAIDFYVWRHGTDATKAEPTKRVMSIDGAGTDGAVRIYGLAGTGTRHVNVNSSGDLITSVNALNMTTVLSIASAPSANTHGAVVATGNYTSLGGTFAVYWSGSAYRGSAGLMSLALYVDNNFYAYSDWYTNEASSHKACPAVMTPIAGLAAGNHTIQIRLYVSGAYVTVTDSNDKFNISVIE